MWIEVPLPKSLMHMTVGIVSQCLSGCWQETLVRCPAGFRLDCLNVLRSWQRTSPEQPNQGRVGKEKAAVPCIIQSPQLTLFLSNHNLMESFNLSAFFTIMKSTVCKSFQITLDALFPTISSLIHYSVTQSQTHQLPILDVIVLLTSIILKISQIHLN